MELPAATARLVLKMDDWPNHCFQRLSSHKVSSLWIPVPCAGTVTTTSWAMGYNSRAAQCSLNAAHPLNPFKDGTKGHLSKPSRLTLKIPLPHSTGLTLHLKGLM
ncbi:unnamed protein product [Durusdinium trenchii]|uniref:Uncharacterized protein n=1 Tax=Durusdinium trenchii TaxID=1381693 RepID=A0ABP0P540_9DINO